MALLPANPGQALWIGSVAGKNHANIGIGQGTSNGAGDHIDYSQSSIEDGSSPPIDANKFFLNSDGNVVFRINASAGTTSSGTKHPRTEDRETTASGGNAAWDGRSGDHYLRARCRITTVTSNRPWVCFGQIHGSSTSPNTSDAIRLQTEGTNGTSTNLSLIARRTPPPNGSEIRTVLRTGYNIGTWFDYEIRQTSGTITVKLDGVTVLTATGMGQIDQYFKYGCYLQDSLGEGASSSDWGAVEFERGSVQVWHTGYPAPTTPVFTGGTDPGGGAGGGAGNDVQAPTVPQNLAAVRGDTQAALSWSASTDNVGVDHYNVYRFSTTGTGGGTGGGSSATVGSTDNGDGATTSSADKIIASRATSTAAGTLAEGHARAWLDASGSTTSRMLVYADSGGAPGAKLATSDQITISTTTADTIQNYVFSGAAQIDLAAATDYWIALAWADPGTPNLTYSRGSVSSGRVERSDITYGTFPDPWGTSTGTFAGPIDAWVTTVSGGATGSGGGSLTSLGKTSDGASSSASSADKTAVSSVTAAASGTLTAGHARAWLSATGSAVTKCVVYADSSGAPGARLASSNPVTITQTAEAVVDYTFSGADAITLTSGTVYWVGLAWQDPGTPSLNISRDATASGRQEVAAYAPTPFGTPSALTGPIDVYVETSSGGGAVGGGFVLLTTTAGTSFTNTSLINGQEYTYAVSAVDAAGNESAMSTPVTVIPGTPDHTPPTVPQNLTAVAGDGQVTLSWSASTDPDTTTTTPPTSLPGPPVGTATTFTEKFDAGTSTPFGQWNSVQNHAYDGSASSYNTSTGYYQTIVADGSAHPNCLRTEVRDGDTAVGTHERAELSSFGKSWNDQQNDERWYEFDFKLGTAPTVGSSDWMIVYQWHHVGTSDDAPPLALSLHSTGAIGFEREANDVIQTFLPVWTPTVGTWYHVIIHVKWSPSSSIGFVHAYVDGVETVPKTFCATQHADDTSNYYVKIGTYRRSTVSGTSVVYHDNLRISGPPATTSTDTGGGGTTTTETASGVLRYNIYRDGVLYATVSANSSTATALVDQNVTNGATYSYTVSAVDGSLNESSQSSSVNATPGGSGGVAIGGAALLPGRLTGGKIEVSIAWSADLTVSENAWAWTDVTGDVRYAPGISTSLGRNDESSTSNPADLTLVLDNSSGDYSSVRRNTPVRVRIDPGDGGGGRVVLQAFSNGFTPGWDSLKGSLPVVTLSASGTLRRLAQGNAPLQSVYRRVMTASPRVRAYWPFEEGESSTFAYPVRGGTPMVLSVDSATPTATPGRPDWRADSSFDCSGPLPRLGRAYFQGDVTAYPNTGTSQVRFLLSIPDSGLTDGTVLMHISMTGTIHRWDITYGITNGVESLGLYRYNASDGSFHSSDFIGFKVNGIPGRLSLDWTQSGSDIIWTMAYTPAVVGVVATFLRRTLTGRTAGIVSHFEVNPHNADIGATIGHLTVEDAITPRSADLDVLTAYVGETNTSSDGRLARLCAENGVPLRRYIGTPADVVAVDEMGPQLVAPLLDLLHECELSGQGQLWDGRSAGLSYTTRLRRQLGTVKLTVDASAKQLAGDFSPVDDDQRDRNKVTVTRLHGVSYTYEDTTGPLGTGPTGIGIYDDAVTVNCMADDSTVDFAKWFVRLGTVPGYRYPSVTVDLAASPTLAAAVLDIVPGERIQVTHLDTTLAQFPTATVSLLVEGIAHEITTRTWRVTFRCSPYGPWATGILGVGTTALIDSGLLDTSTLG